MEVFANLFDDWVGILSIGVVLGVIGIAIFFLLWFMNKAKQEPSADQ